MREHLPVLYLMLEVHVIHYSRLILAYIKLTNAYVKMCISWRQYAWVGIKLKRLFSTHQRLNEEHLHDKERIWFEQWLVGFTDGDGTFHISHQNKGNKWGLAFKLSQSRYNLRVLNYAKKNLGVGSITKDGNTKAQFFVRDRKQIEDVIVPIFDKYPLLTSKYFDYARFRKALDVFNDPSLTKTERDLKLSELKNSEVPSGCISPAWDKVNLPLNEKSAKGVMSKPWLIGFTESEGSFYLTTKDPNTKRIVHAFGFSQKLDIIVLQSLGVILHIPTAAKLKDKHNYHLIDTTNSGAIEYIIDYYKNTLKGVKSLEYRIWARAYNQNKGDYKKLYSIRDMVRKLRKTYLDIKK